MASTPRSSLEHLLLAQAVYQNGSSDWTVVCGLLNGHPLTAYTDAHNGGWAEADAETVYGILMDAHPPPGVVRAGSAGGEGEDRRRMAPKDKAALWVAQVAYKARMVEIKQEIHREEDKFKALFAEMETLKALPTYDLPPPSPPPSPPPPPPPRQAPKPIRALPKPKPKINLVKASASRPTAPILPASDKLAKPARPPNPNAPPRNPNWGPNTHPKKAMPPPGARWGPNTHPKKAMHKYITEPIGGGRSTSSGLAGVGKGKNLKPVKPGTSPALPSPAPTTSNKLAGQAKSIPFPPRKTPAGGSSSAGGSVPPSPAQPVASGSGSKASGAGSAAATGAVKRNKAQSVLKEAEARRAEEAAKKAKERDERMAKKAGGGAAAGVAEVGTGRKRTREGQAK